MGQQITSVRGTVDVLPSDSGRWQYTESLLRDVCRRYNYREIRLPTFEYTELFARGVGDGTDVVNKEMYTFDDRGNRSITLRPEGTASVVRSFLEHGVLAGPLPARAYYLMSCFRYEKPQSGRLREFHTIGAELFGCAEPEGDVEVISAAGDMLRSCGISEFELHLNSIGCPVCRAEYRKALIAFLKEREQLLCDTCRERMERNPLRVLDCKSPECQSAVKDAPVVLDYLCDDCREHFEKVKRGLEKAGIPYSIDPRIVRGLDYYTRTVFEFISTGEGYKGTLCGGGRYDGLVELLGGKPTPAVGFGLGIDRLMAVMQARENAFPPEYGPDLYAAYVSGEQKDPAADTVRALRRLGASAEYDLTGRSLKAQLKYADKARARFLLVLGEDEIKNSRAKLKNMITGVEAEIELEPEKLFSAIKQ